MTQATNKIALAQPPVSSGASNTQMVARCGLPMDPVRHIFTFLSVKEWAGATRTCRQWKSAVDLTCERFREASGRREAMTGKQRAEAMRVCVLMHHKELGVSGEMLSDFFDPMNFEASTEPLFGDGSDTEVINWNDRLTILIPKLAVPFFANLKTLSDETWPSDVSGFQSIVWSETMMSLESLELVGQNANVRRMSRSSQYKSLRNLEKLRTLILRSGSIQEEIAPESLKYHDGLTTDIISAVLPYCHHKAPFVRLELHMRAWRELDWEVCSHELNAPYSLVARSLQELRIDLSQGQTYDRAYGEQALDHLAARCEHLTLLETGDPALDQSICKKHGELFASRKAKQGQS